MTGVEVILRQVVNVADVVGIAERAAQAILGVYNSEVRRGHVESKPRHTAP